MGIIETGDTVASRIEKPFHRRTSWLDKSLAAGRGKLFVIALVYLGTLGLAEVLTALIEPRFGITVYGILLIALFFHGSISGRGAQRRFLIALALAPLLRLVSLGMPLGYFPLEYWYILVGMPLFLAVYQTARSARLNRKMIGIHLQAFPSQLIIGATGIGLGLIEWLILKPNPLVLGLRLEQILAPALILLIFTGLLEELIFRGVLQYASIFGLGRVGLLYVSLVFAMLHLSYRSALDVLFVFAVAIYFGWAVQRTGSIIGVTLAHGLANIGLYLIFPFLLVSRSTPPVIPVTAPPDILAPAGAVTPISPAIQPNLPAITPTDLPATITFTPVIDTSTGIPAERLIQPQAGDDSPVVANPGQSCGPPPGWVIYTLQRGDSLTTLSARYGIRVAALIRANCLTNPNQLYWGQQLWVPYTVSLPSPWIPSETPFAPTATSIPTGAATSTPTPTIQPSETPLPVSPTSAPASLPTIVPTEGAAPASPTPEVHPTEMPPTPSLADSATPATTSPPPAVPTEPLPSTSPTAQVPTNTPPPTEILSTQVPTATVSDTPTPKEKRTPGTPTPRPDTSPTQTDGQNNQGIRLTGIMAL